MNSFEALCQLASKESWCWKLFCTTCGHMHFRYSFLELIAGKSPVDSNWLINVRETNYSYYLDSFPNDFSVAQKEKIIGICTKSSITLIASSCRFPDWLGYMGLVLEDMYCQSQAYNDLSSNWSLQLASLVAPNSHIYTRLGEVSEGNSLLNLKDLEDCELHIIHNKKNQADT